MGTMSHQTILFLCTGNFYRSRFAETLFNELALREELPWRATSRALALERGVNNVGPMAPDAIDALLAQGIRALLDFARYPAAVTSDDLERAHRVIALKREEHLPLVQERHPTFVQKVEYWHIDDVPGILPLIDTEVRQLITALRASTPRQPSVPPAVCSLQNNRGKSAPVVRVGRETKGRRGKGVTVVSDLPLNEQELLALATRLKDRCGTGGTVKEGRIEIQGDQRDRLIVELEALGYRVKRAGG